MRIFAVGYEGKREKGDKSTWIPGILNADGESGEVALEKVKKHVLAEHGEHKGEQWKTTDFRVTSLKTLAKTEI